MRNFISGLFGIWIVLVTLVLSPGTTQRVFLVISGIAVALIAFWSASEKSTNHV
ncbi:MAG: hypothetical protein HY006_00490 [Candidatus Sungbacteria bacterium]|nr:hypothetical protein [Candidatus Sungbacteria bacterium]